LALFDATDHDVHGTMSLREAILLLAATAASGRTLAYKKTILAACKLHKKRKSRKQFFRPT